MLLIGQRPRLLLGLAALLFGVVACHGGSSAGTPFVPQGSALSQSQPPLDLSPAHAPRGVIVSSCGTHIRIKIAGILNCRFREYGYHDGKFTVKNDTRGLVLFSPNSGNKHTTFTMIGLVAGSGFLVVHDSLHHVLVVHVRVTLL
jgi:hypothetical protein